MSKPLVALRNEISKQAYEVPADEAEQILAHPIWGKINKVVRTAKPEVLHDADEKAKESVSSLTDDEHKLVDEALNAEQADQKKRNKS